MPQAIQQVPPAQNIKELLKKEYLLCQQNPVYFMKKYCYIQHRIRGKILFSLYPFQEKVLNIFANNDKNIVLKSRQLGISTLVAGYSLWLMLFQSNKNILVVCTNQSTSKNMVTSVTFMYENLPTWLKLGSKEKNKLSLKLKNESGIKAVSSSTTSTRSEAVSLLIIDEGAFIPNADELWTGAQQTLATGGKAIILSTPNGTGNWFHKMWEKSEINAEDNEFIPIRLPWYLHPERDETWRRKQDSDLGLRMAAQECDCDFSTSGETVIEPDTLKIIEAEWLEEPIEKRGATKDFWIWQYVDYQKTYIVPADVARGDSSDYSAFHVICVETGEQVAEFKGQLDTREYGQFLVSVATEYNNALLAIENANIGWDVVQTVRSLGYTNMYCTPKGNHIPSLDSYLNHDDNNETSTPGFTTSMKSRPLMISALIQNIKDNGIRIKSRRTLVEFKVFVWKNGRAQAQFGYNDDLIMALAIGCFLRETSVRFKDMNLDLTKASIDGFRTNNGSMPISTVSMYNNITSNPWSQQVGNVQESLTWLL